MGRMLAAGLLALIAGCGNGEGSDITMHLSPSQMQLLPGARDEVRAYHTLDGETWLVVEALIWTSSDPAVVEVEGSGGGIGPVTALDPGSVTIRAESETFSLEESMSIRVRDAEVTAIDLSEAEATVLVGGSVYLYATATYDSSDMLDVTMTASWSSDTPGVALADDGAVSGVAPGTAIVTVEFRGASAAIPVTVTDSAGP